MRRSGSAAARSAPERGAGLLITRRFSSSCSGLLMPESTIFTPSKSAAKRRAKPAGLLSLTFANSARASSGSWASRPPRTGSITTTGFWWRRQTS